MYFWNTIDDVCWISILAYDLGFSETIIPQFLVTCAHGVSAKKNEVWLGQSFGTLARCISWCFIYHTLLLHTYLVHAFLTFSLIVVLMSCRLHRTLQKCCRYLGSSFLGVIPAFIDERNRIIEQHYLGLGQTSRQEMQEILLCSGNKVGLTVYNWRIPKKRYLKTGKICGFSQNLSFGVFVGNACFLWQTGEFSKKKEKRKLVMIFTNL